MKINLPGILAVFYIVTFTTAHGALVARFAMDENTSNITSGVTPAGTSLTATLSAGTTWTTGHVGNGLSFDGSSSGVVSGAPDQSIFSVSFWIKPTATAQTDKQLVVKLDDAGKKGFRLTLSGTTVNFQVPTNATPGWDHLLAATVPVVLGSWNHVAATYDGTTMRLYINGAFAGWMARTGAVAASGTNLIFGAFNNTGLSGYNGLMDDLRIYSHALGEPEILAMAPRDQRFYLPFTEGTGYNVVRDPSNAFLASGTSLAWGAGCASASALSFSGTTNTLQAGNSPDLQVTNQVSLACWVYPATSTGDRQLVVKLDGAGKNGFRLGVNGVTPYFQVPDGSNAWSYNVTSDRTLPLNTWSHIVGTYDGTTMIIYVNGNPCAHPLTRTGAQIFNSNTNLFVGAFDATGNAAFAGRIDDMRVFGKALTPQDVGQVMGFATKEFTTVSRGDAIITRDFEPGTAPNQQDEWGTTTYRSWVAPGANGTGTAMQVTSAGNVADFSSIPLDLLPYRGTKLYIEANVKASNIVLTNSDPKVTTYGIKVMLRVEDASGTVVYPQVALATGSYGWTLVGMNYYVPANVVRASLSLGIEQATGTAWFDDVKIYCMQPWETRHRPVPVASAPAPDPGHGLTNGARGVMTLNYWMSGDYDALATWQINDPSNPKNGAKAVPNLLRFPMVFDADNFGSITNWTNYQSWLTWVLSHDLPSFLNWAKIHGAKVIVDLHNPPGGTNPDHSDRMFYEATVNANYVSAWTQIATTLKSNSNYSAIWAYDLINEPIETKPAPAGLGVFDSQIAAAHAIRNNVLDSQVSLIVEADDYTSSLGFSELMPLPSDITKVTYELHMYAPDYYCSQGLPGFLDQDPILTAPYYSYPGNLKNSGNYIDINYLRSNMQPVRDFQQAYNVPIYVGEFNAVRYAVGAANYTADCITLFEGWGWPWTYIAYRSSQYWDPETPSSPVTPVPSRTTTDTDRKKAIMYGNTETLANMHGFFQNWP